MTDNIEFGKSANCHLTDMLSASSTRTWRKQETDHGLDVSVIPSVSLLFQLLIHYWVLGNVFTKILKQKYAGRVRIWGASAIWNGTFT